jgi:hypothetical protein
MELITGIITTILVIGVFILSVAWIVIFMGMHNNTKDGNSFRLLNPFILFMPGQFNEVGNKYRRAMLWIYLGSFIISAAIYYVRDYT